MLDLRHVPAMSTGADFYDLLSMVFSITGGILGLISLYFSYLNVGTLSVMPIRVFKIVPDSFGDVRRITITIPMTFINNGAGQKVIPDLRIRVETPDGDIILDWSEELDEMPIYSQRDQHTLLKYPFQPTLKGYESISKVYGFRSLDECTPIVRSLERDGDIRKMEDKDPTKDVAAYIEARNSSGRWFNLCKFYIHYNGPGQLESDYERINKIEA